MPQLNICSSMFSTSQSLPYCDIAKMKILKRALENLCVLAPHGFHSSHLLTDNLKVLEDLLYKIKNWRYYKWIYIYVLGVTFR